jgi:tetratricopeptide (TPR) repeat protein
MVKHKLLFGFLFLFVCIFWGCEDKERTYISEKLDQVELLLDDDRLDSAHNVIGRMSSMVEDMNEGEKMRYDLLRVSCMNKMFVSLAGEEEVMLGVVGYYEEHGDADEKMESCLLMGSVYRDMGDAPMALEWFGKAVEHGNKGAKNKTLLAKIHGQKAEQFEKQRLYDDALKELDEMKRLALMVENKSLFVNALSMQSTIQFCDGKYKAAATTYLQAAEMLVNELQDTVRAAIISTPAISSYLALCQYDSVAVLMSFYEEQSGLFENDGNIVEGYESYYLDKGDMLLGINELDSAIKYYMKAKSAKQINNRCMAYYNLAEVYKRLSVNDSVSKYALLACNNSRKYFDELQTNTVQQVEGTYNYDRYRLKSVEKELEAERSRNALIVVLGIISIIVIFTIMLWNKWKAKKKLEMEELKGDLERSKAETYQIMNERQKLSRLLEEKNGTINELIDKSANDDVLQQEKIESLRVEIHRLNEALEETENKYSDIIEEKKGVVSSVLVKADNREECLSNDDWCKLEAYTVSLYPGFYVHLRSVLPNIKLEQLQIATLVKLGFTPTQISVLLVKSVQSITNSRRRMFLKVHGGDKCTTEDADRWIR